MPLRFSPAARPRRKHRNPKTKINHRSRPFPSASFSAPTAAFIKATPAGKNWDHLNISSGGEFYRISLDDSQPFYRIAGGLQDNCNFVGPSGVQSKDGIRNSDWTNLGGGDGFYVVFDPTDRDMFYAESQEGSMHRINLRTGERRQLTPQPAEGQDRYRFHWNSPLIGSKHQPGVLYLAGNRVFRLTDQAENYAVISPDLTRNDPAQDERHRKRRGKLRRRLFVSRIAGQSRTSLGRNR